MGDAEISSQQSKKRAAGREISRDNPGLDDDEEHCEEEMGTFKKASEEVLARRKIVKVRRNQMTTASSTVSSNPFASIKLAPAHDSSGTNSVAVASSIASSNPFASLKLAPFPDSSGTNVVTNNETESCGNSLSKAEVKVDATSEIDGQSEASKTQSESGAIPDDLKHGGEEGPNQPEAIDNKEAVADKAKDEKGKNVVESEDIKKDAEAQTMKNEEEQTNGNEKAEKTGEATHFSSFQQLSSSQNAFSGLGTGFSSSNFLFGSSLTKDGSSPASGSSSLFGLKNDSSSSGLGSNSAKTEGTALPLMQEVSVETGEENEKSVFTADSVLYDFVEGTWKERGKGELKVNVSTTGTGKARLIMRTRGNYRLIMNASIYPEMKVTNMDKRGVTFACMNSADEGKNGLSTYAVKFKDVSMVEKFRSCVTENKDNKIAVAPLKTPENSPHASDD